MKVLIDTCVLSEIQRPAPNPAVLGQVAAIPHADLFISVITFGELVKGVERLAVGQRRQNLQSWLA